MTSAKSSVFISYAHENARIVSAVVERIERAGYSVWYDRDIKVSSVWTDEIAGAIDGCEVVVVFLSRESVASLFVQSEIEYAFRRQKKIVPVYLDPVEKLPPGLALGLNSIQGVVANGSAAIAERICVGLSHNKVGKKTSKPLIKLFAVLLVLLIAAIAAGYLAYEYDPRAKRFLKTEWKRLERTLAPQTTIALTLAKTTYAPAEPLVVKLDAAIQKKISSDAIVVGIANIGAPDGEWLAVKEPSKPSAAVVLRVPGETGRFEARVYVKGGGSPIASKIFAVAGNAFGACNVKTNKSSYNFKEKISVKISGAKKDAIDDRMIVGVWRVWASGETAIEKKIVAKKDATIVFFAPNVNGRYEIRVYNNAEILAEATLTAKARISVRDTKK
jgi:hypothetical protein